ncbi:TlpA family protein disulfide reductase [Hymenobacter sp. BRD128]|uniref:peroxiredoxin family protein n=1 Tax=Hymenobacter sp. BRD128 TaxID=2675878 RepID=UPI001567908D|nr:TlpA disulfide reductase family protein [Hymenobacter sp. BRD128]QKG55959.1 TlpA family protein disulfide reductase [Hymenobacter sp. BRD128]
MKSLSFALLAATLLAGCNSSTTSNSGEASAVSAAALLTPGPWRGELATQGQKIPFLFEVKTEASQPVVYLINKGLNGEERLRCEEISAAGDSVTIRMHVFDAALVVRADGKDKLQGTWVKYDSKMPYRVPLVATAGSETDTVKSIYKRMPLVGFTGNWRTTFRDDTGSSYEAVGVFAEKQRANPPVHPDQNLTGTFLTTTGDYRYLSGYSGEKSLSLSTFDGSHAFLFTGKKQPDGTIKGNFYSGKSGHETWTATLDPKAKLPDADTLTYLRKGESRLNFKFPSIVAGASISPTDPKYKGKVVVLQILGSWCPNCMDETNYLAPWYEQNKARGVEIIGLGYERSPDYQQAASRLLNMKKRFNIGYDLAVAGVSNKDSVAKSLPQLAKFLGFPTTIFLDKKGVVRSIRTGFSGPGTGQYYEEEKAHFNRTIDKLLKE